MTMLLVFVKASGILAPLVFIALHIMRQFLFIPVAVVCIIGGILFGAVFGTIYSIIGLTAGSILFYILLKRIPKTFGKIMKMKEKWLGNKVNFTIGQIAILRLIPFVHFHLLSLCIIEVTRNFRHYVRGSLYANVPLALFYTVFGQFIREFSLTIIMMILLALTLLFYLLREKQVVIKWRDFF